MEVVQDDRLDTLIRYYFHRGLQQREIQLYLLTHGVDISIRTLKRRLRVMRLYRRKMYTSIETVRNFLFEQLLGSGQMPGYKWLHRRCIQNGMIVKQNVVRHLMHTLDPEGMRIRRRRRLRRRQYFNKGPNYLWHLDGYDKLKPYGICVSGCIDGFSRKILWLKAAYSNNNPQIICGYFLQTVTKLKGCPQSIRTDMGTENTLVERVQEYFHETLGVDGDHIELPPFLYGTSHANQRIEAWWAMLRRQNSQYWMNRFQQLKDDGIFNGSIVDKSVLQYCFMDLIQAELNEFVEEWNGHVIRRTRNTISPSGRPNIMYDFPAIYYGRDFLNRINEIYVDNCAELCITVTRPCEDENLLELCEIISKENNIQTPENVYQAINNYCELRQEIMKLLE